MASTEFQNDVTLTDADWFNDVDRVVYDILQDPADAAAARAALGITAGDFIPTAARGVANGVASLDVTTHVPAAQIPDLSATYRPLTNMTFTAPVLHADGTVGAPGISWADDPDSGWFRNPANSDTGYSVNTSVVFSFGNTVIVSNRPHSFITRAIVHGSYSGALADVATAPLFLDCENGTVSGPTTGICLYKPSVGAWVMQIYPGAPVLQFGEQSAGGPAGLGGWSQQFLVDGGIQGGAYQNMSDASLKSDIRQMTSALADVLKLRGVRYYNTISKKEDIGLVAQEVEPVFPETVSEVVGGEGQKALHYSGLIAPIIEAIRELTARVAALEAKVGLKKS